MPLTQVQGGMILPSTTLTTPIVATTMGVGGATPAASGSGITFPSSQSASSNANTLDDYEEGTWTPTISSAGYTADVNTGIYTKVGRVVTIQHTIRFTAVSANNSDVDFTGMPFVALNYQSGGCIAGVCRENSAVGAIYVTNVQSGGSAFEINSMDGVGSGQQRTIRTGEFYCSTMTYFTS
jgi:hypothetical protein